VLTRSAITLPKVNRFGRNLEHCEPIVGCWPWQILGAIRAVATVSEAAKIFCEVNNTRFLGFPVGQILRHSNTTTSVGVVVVVVVSTVVQDFYFSVLAVFMRL